MVFGMLSGTPSEYCISVIIQKPFYKVYYHYFQTTSCPSLQKLIALKKTKLLRLCAIKLVAENTSSFTAASTDFSGKCWHVWLEHCLSTVNIMIKIIKMLIVNLEQGDKISWCPVLKRHCNYFTVTHYHTLSTYWMFFMMVESQCSGAAWRWCCHRVSVEMKNIFRGSNHCWHHVDIRKVWYSLHDELSWRVFTFIHEGEEAIQKHKDKGLTN